MCASRPEPSSVSSTANFTRPRGRPWRARPASERHGGQRSRVSRWRARWADAAARAAKPARRNMSLSRRTTRSSAAVRRARTEHSEDSVAPGLANDELAMSLARQAREHLRGCEHLSVVDHRLTLFWRVSENAVDDFADGSATVVNEDEVVLGLDAMQPIRRHVRERIREGRPPNPGAPVHAELRFEPVEGRARLIAKVDIHPRNDDGVNVVPVSKRVEPI